MAETEVVDWDDIGITDDVIVSMAAFNAVDAFKEALNNIRDYATRRQTVESLIADYEALDKHQVDTSRADDKGSIVGNAKAESDKLCGIVEDLVSISVEMPAKHRKRMSRHATAAITRLATSSKRLRSGICTLELTDIASIDDDNEAAVDQYEAAVNEMLSTMEWLKKRRREWAKSTLKKLDPKMLARLQLMAIQRRDILQATKDKVDAGEMAPEEGAAILRGLRLVKSTEESEVLDGEVEAVEAEPEDVIIEA